MGASIPIRGTRGAVRWAYYTAAAIEGYAVRPIGAGLWSLSATVTLADAYRLRQRPLTFAAELEHNRIWLWPILELELVDRRLTARLGPPVT